MPDGTLAELARRDARRVAADRVRERGRRVVESAAEAALDLLDQCRALVDERRVELDERRAGADLRPGGVSRIDAADADQRHLAPDPQIGFGEHRRRKPEERLAREPAAFPGELTLAQLRRAGDRRVRDDEAVDPAPERRRNERVERVEGKVRRALAAAPARSRASTARPRRSSRKASP